MRRNQELDAITDRLDLVGINYTIERGRQHRNQVDGQRPRQDFHRRRHRQDWRGTLNNKAQVSSAC